MSKYQKVIALIFRMISLGMIIYSCITAASAAIMMPHAVWLLIPSLVAGIILYFAAIPLAWLATRGIDD